MPTNYARRGQTLTVPGVGDHRVAHPADVANLIYVGDRCVGVSEHWSGYQGSNNKPGGDRYLLIREGVLVETPRESVPAEAERICRDCVTGRVFREKARR